MSHHISSFLFESSVNFRIAFIKLTPPPWTALYGDLQESDIYDNRELNRRTAVNRSRVLLRLLYNSKAVCTSQTKVLGQDFVIPVGQIFPIQILQWPDSGLRIQILEGTGGLRNSLLAEVEIPLCGPDTSLDKDRPLARSL